MAIEIGSIQQLKQSKSDGGQTELNHLDYQTKLLVKFTHCVPNPPPPPSPSFMYDVPCYKPSAKASMYWRRPSQNAGRTTLGMCNAKKSWVLHHWVGMLNSAGLTLSMSFVPCAQV